MARASVCYVFREAEQTGVRSSWGEDFQDYVNHNILATQVLLEACREANMKRLCFVLVSLRRR